MFNEDSSLFFVWEVPLVTFVLHPELILSQGSNESASEGRYPVRSVTQKSVFSPNIAPTLQPRQMCLSLTPGNHSLPRYQEGLLFSTAYMTVGSKLQADTVECLLFYMCLFGWLF